MKVKFALGILITMLLMLGGTMASPVTAQSPADGRALKVLSSGAQEIVLELVVPAFEVETIDYEGQTYQRFVIPNMAQTHHPGDPQVPVLGAFLGVPSTEGVSVEVVAADYETLRGYRLYPAPAIALIGADIVDPADIERVEEVFTLNQKRYAANTFYPGGLAEIGETGALRDQAVASVQFYPVQYNPASGEVRLYRRIVARVTWSTSLSLQADSQTRRASPTYEKVLQNTLLNYDHLDRSAATKEAPLFDTGTAIGAASSTDKLKIGVTQDGIYQLNPGDLSGSGFSLTGVTLSNIKMENRGVEIPIYVHDDNSNDAFDGSDYILFYGTAITDVYTTKNIYWLEEGSGLGARMSERSVPPGSATLATEFPTTLHAEEDTEYWVVLPNGEGQDHWFWGDYLNGSESRDYSLTLNNVSKTGGSVTVRVRLHGRTAPNHTTKIYFNGVDMGNQVWSGQVVYDYEVTVSDSLLNEGLNTITVEAVDSGLNQFYVNWIELDYRDTYVAENNELLFGAPSAGNFQFNVTGFSSSDIQVFDVTDPAGVVVLADTITAGSSVQFEDTAGTDTHYLALATVQRKSPDSIELDEPSDLKGSNNGHYIIITHEDFYSSAQTLAAHRSSTGVTAGKPVATVKVEDIYDEFNYGIFNPQAIRDFISYADDNWGGDPAYVLLLGGASYDYRDLLGLSRDNFVPTQMIETAIAGQTPSDNWFVTDDILPYMFIGRLTPQNSAEAADMVNKTIYYENNPPTAPWNTEVLLVADDDDPVFETNSELIVDALPAYYTFDRVYVGDYPPGDPATDITNGINSGKLLVNYSGHGNVITWGGFYTSGNIPGLNNTNKLPLVTAATCLNGYFVGRNTSMTEEFLKRNNKGAAAVWADAGEGTPSGHEVLMGEFYDTIFQEDKYALGEATWQAKINAYAQSSTWAEMVKTFGLFGDPAMQLGLPENYPYVESTTPVNGATEVPVDQDIEIVFSKPMNPATVNLTGATGLTPSWNSDKTIVTYSHSDFAYGATLTLSVTGQDNVGNSLGPGLVPSTWSFSTPTAPSQVDIDGPTEGIIDAAYVFNASVGPSTTTLPLTYVWEATGQSTVTHTDVYQLNDSSTPFVWNTPGIKTVTVTVSNAIGLVVGTHLITINVPPDSVNITGATVGATGNAYTFNATVNPANTTQPITYVWEATDMAGQETHTGGDLDDSFTFTWTEPGLKTVTVTASNGWGSVNTTYQIDVKAPPTAVDIDGPTAGVVQVDYIFVAATNPPTATLPLSYTWQATDKGSVTRTKDFLTDWIVFNWDTPGLKEINVTVSNEVGLVTNNYFVTIDYAAPTELTINGPTVVALDTAYTFDALVGPITATQPIAYQWAATEQTGETHTGGDLDDSMTFTWNTLGPKVITVTATNAGGSLVETHEIEVVSTSVNISGPLQGVIGTQYTFNGAVDPSTASQPITYQWQATEQTGETHTGGDLDDSMAFIWNTPGLKEITVTATNAEGTVTDNHYITLYVPPTSVDIAGPTMGVTNTTYTFDAAVSPGNTTEPVTYEWEATGQPSLPPVYDGGLTHSMDFQWDTYGSKTITVTTTNAWGTATDVHVIDIPDPSQSPGGGTVYLPIIIKNK